MSKAKGTRWELECQKMLEAEGYWVTKAGGSLGAFDLIALGEHDTYCIQCKCNGWASPAEREVMARLPAMKRKNHYAEIWRKDDWEPAPRVMCLSDKREWNIEEEVDYKWQSIRRRLKEPNGDL